jgi:NAD(P)-dependent dehydrogenase (short-subunit alcohol dehydrogenase family)
MVVKRTVNLTGATMELKGKTAVITGGASGIGLATAKRFAASGANLVLGDIEEAPLAAAVLGLTDQGARVIGVAGDVAQEADVFAMRDAALAEFGAVHLVFNNAGVGGGLTIGTPKAIWDWVLGVNIDGVVNGVNAFVPLFLEQDEGHVINTASEAGLVGVPGSGPYCASKFAVVGLSEALFQELALTGKNVHVTVLCPNFVRTRINESQRNMPSELLSYLEDPVAQEVKKLADAAVNSGIDPADVAQMVEDAVVANRFWILTNEHSATRITEQRLAWMRGGRPPMAKRMAPKDP